MADAQLHIRFNQSIPQSPAVSFFHDIPRWPNSRNEFELSFDYLNPVALTALISVFVALIFIFLFIIQLSCRYSARESKVDDRIFRMHRSRNYTILQISLAVTLTFATTLFIAVAMISIVALNFSFQDGLNMIGGVAEDLFHVSSGLVDVAQQFRDRFVNFNPNASQDSGVVSGSFGDFLTPAFSSLRAYALEHYPDFTQLNEAISTRSAQVRNVLRVVSRAVNIVSAGLLAIIISLLAAPALHFLVDALPLTRRYRFCRIMLHVLVSVFPTLLAWSFLGVTSAVGATLSDICMSLHDYRSVLLNEIDPSTVPMNAFVKGDVLCPSNIDPGRIRSQFNSTVAAILQNQFTRTTISKVLGTSAESVAMSAEWSRDKVMGYVDCSALITFSGKVEFIACGQQGKSAIQSVVDLWAAFLGISLALTIAVFLSLWGIRIGWGLLVWPREHIESRLNMEELASARERLNGSAERNDSPAES